jgi:DNA-binding CsgD family transcriptional regulator
MLDITIEKINFYGKNCFLQSKILLLAKQFRKVYIMFSLFKPKHRKKVTLIIFFVLLLLLIFDIVDGLTSDEIARSSFLELIILSTHEIVTIFLVVTGLYLLWNWYQDANFEIDILSENIQTLDSKLQLSEQQLSSYKESLNSLLQGYFKKWSLSKSEAEVCCYLIKGLTIKDIAKQRSTSERTVRNQATTVYDKANVAGRHELAAVFLNSFLSF